MTICLRGGGYLDDDGYDHWELRRFRRIADEDDIEEDPGLELGQVIEWVAHVLVKVDGRRTRIVAVCTNREYPPERSPERLAYWAKMFTRAMRLKALDWLAYSEVMYSY